MSAEARVGRWPSLAITTGSVLLLWPSNARLLLLFFFAALVLLLLTHSLPCPSCWLFASSRYFAIRDPCCSLFYDDWYDVTLLILLYGPASLIYCAPLCDDTPGKAIGSGLSECGCAFCESECN